jgi:ABC-type branched-subunit amino acid transport system ATPase component
MLKQLVIVAGIASLAAISTVSAGTIKIGFNAPLTGFAAADGNSALSALREGGLAVLLVEQNTEQAIQVADRVVALESGDLTWAGTGDEARARPDVLSAYL